MARRFFRTAAHRLWRRLPSLNSCIICFKKSRVTTSPSSRRAPV